MLNQNNPPHNPAIGHSFHKYRKDYVPVPEAKQKVTPKLTSYPEYTTNLQKNDQPFLVGSLDQQMLDDYNKLMAERD